MRLGILGTGKIVQDFLPIVKSIPAIELVGFNAAECGASTRAASHVSYWNGLHRLCSFASRYDN